VHYLCQQITRVPKNPAMPSSKKTVQLKKLPENETK
jgi:hypothetical protein